MAVLVQHDRPGKLPGWPHPHLGQIAAHQATINEDLHESIRQQVVISQRLEITQARYLRNRGSSERNML